MDWYEALRWLEQVDNRRIYRAHKQYRPSRHQKGFGWILQACSAHTRTNGQWRVFHINVLSDNGTNERSCKYASVGDEQYANGLARFDQLSRMGRHAAITFSFSIQEILSQVENVSETSISAPWVHHVFLSFEFSKQFSLK